MTSITRVTDLRPRPGRFWQRTVAVPRLGSGDPWLLGAVAVLLALGTVMVFNASYFYARDVYGDPLFFVWRHVTYIGIGVIVATAAARRPWTFWERWARALVLFAAVALLAVLLFGREENGARRWLSLGFLPLTVQPSEFVKTILVIYLARYLARRHDKLHLWWEGILPPLFLTGVLLALLYCQPDFGTMMILAATAGGMLFVAGVSRKQIAILATLAIAGATAGILAEPYRVSRIVSFLSAWERERDVGYQLVQSMIAVGSGGLTGVGLGASQQKLFFLPAAHTDFIFALIGEELGLLGVAVVLGLFALIAQRGLRIARGHEELFVRFLACGLAITLVFEAWLNMAVVLGMAPTKGLALPFVSYGGSALVGALLRVGILWNLSRSTSS
ncbi:MAG: putative lipid II flippase FtsW [Candidatus Binatia bacterium]|nr:putative lipid II flippase FtsW [Candidatus Binatia bacterium]